MTSQLKTKKKPTESVVGAYRVHWTDQYTAGSPPLFGGSTSWFKYEELIYAWLDLTVLEAEKRGPALKNGLVEVAEMYKGLLDRELKNKQEVRRLWIRTHQQPEKGGMLDR